jgi:hypothetical protein
MYTIFFSEFTDYTATRLDEVIDDFLEGTAKTLKDNSRFVPISLPPGKILRLSIDVIDKP